MKEMVLLRGEVALVDDDVFEQVKSLKWRTDTNGYVVTGNYKNGTKGTFQSLHRLIMQAPSHLMVDHVDGSPLNNLRSNLRVCTNSQNQANRYGTGGQTSSRFRGVYWEAKGQVWRARIQVKGKTIHLGKHPSELDAAEAYVNAARFYWGEFANQEVIRRVEEARRLNEPQLEAAV